MQSSSRASFFRVAILLRPPEAFTRPPAIAAHGHMYISSMLNQHYEVLVTELEATQQGGEPVDGFVAREMKTVSADRG